jgi:hypothetical protein
MTCQALDPQGFSLSRTVRNLLILFIIFLNADSGGASL